MSDDEITTALRRWAEATDPGDDPLAGPRLRAMPAEPIALSPRRRRPRAWAVAAAVVAVAALGAGVLWATSGDDGRAEVATGPEAEGTPAPVRVPVQVIVVGADLGPETTLSTLALAPYCPPDGGCGSGAAVAPAMEGTALVFVDEEALSGSELVVQYTSSPCEGVGCRPEGPDGAPASIAPGTTSCDVRFTVGPGPTRIVVEVSGHAPAAPTCAASTTEEPPPLTVPPAFSVRERLPWACGTAAWDAGTLPGPEDISAAAEALTCLGSAIEDGEPVELPTSEIGPADDVRRLWWRVLPGARVEIVRSPWVAGGGTWTVERCPVASLRPSAEVLALPTCEDAAEEALPLDLPPLAPAAPPPTPPGETVDLVVDPQALPIGREGIGHWWMVLDAEGAEVARGPLDHQLVERPALVAGDIPAPSADGATLRWEMYDCSGAGCPDPAVDGPPPAGLAPFATCDAAVPARAPGDDVLVLVLDGGTLASDTDAEAPSCSVTAHAALPPLAVPPAWSQRDRLPVQCTSDELPPFDPDTAGVMWSLQCAQETLEEGRSLEMTVGVGPDAWVVLRVHDGSVLVVRQPLGPEAPGAWTEQSCTGLGPAAAPAGIEATGCGPEQEMSLKPPA